MASSDLEARLRRVEQLLERITLELTKLEDRLAHQADQVIQIPTGGQS
jgi:hypothetical protein